MTVAFERDADDLRLIMQHYLDAGNQDRIYSEQGDCSDLLNEEFDYERASARILGRDVGRLLTDTSRQIVVRVLSQETRSTRRHCSCHGNDQKRGRVLWRLRLCHRTVGGGAKGCFRD